MDHHEKKALESLGAQLTLLLESCEGGATVDQVRHRLGIPRYCPDYVILQSLKCGVKLNLLSKPQGDGLWRRGGAL